jgi:hypothetical protein
MEDWEPSRVTRLGIEWSRDERIGSVMETGGRKMATNEGHGCDRLVRLDGAWARCPKAAEYREHGRWLCGEHLPRGSREYTCRVVVGTTANHRPLYCEDPKVGDWRGRPYCESHWPGTAEELREAKVSTLAASKVDAAKEAQGGRAADVGQCKLCGGSGHVRLGGLPYCWTHAKWKAREEAGREVPPPAHEAEPGPPAGPTYAEATDRLRALGELLQVLSGADASQGLAALILDDVRSILRPGG